MRCLVEFRHEVIIGLELVKLILIEFSYIRLLDLRKLADSWRPEEQSQDVLTADPTLIFQIGLDYPLSWARHKLFEPQVPCNDTLALIQKSVVHHFCHAFWLHNTLKLEASSELCPLLLFIYGLGNRVSSKDREQRASWWWGSLICHCSLMGHDVWDLNIALGFDPFSKPFYHLRRDSLVTAQVNGLQTSRPS